MGVANRWKEILLAEDSPADADLLRVSLRDYGRLPCRLHVVPDGEAVLAFLRHEGLYAGMPRPDLLILDIGLPKVGGWKVLKTLRETPTLASLPVVMLTGAMMDADAVHREALRPLAYFVKPVLLREYRQLVEEIGQLVTSLPRTG